MKIAFPARDGQIDPHFGGCEYFIVMTVENNKIQNEERLDPPAGCGCKSDIVSTLAQMGVNVMLAGNMGQGAVNVLSNHGIQVIRGCSGDPKNAAEQWLAGNISDSLVVCIDHDSCSDH